MFTLFALVTLASAIPVFKKSHPRMSQKEVESDPQEKYQLNQNGMPGIFLYFHNGLQTEFYDVDETKIDI